MIAPERLAVVGLGKLGLSLATSFAVRGFDVLGVDLSESVVAKVNAGVAPLPEPGLDAALRSVAGVTLRATLSIEAAVLHGDVTFILVPSASLADGRFGTAELESALVPLCRAVAAHGKEHHVLVLCSTVQPGACAARLVPLIEQVSGRVCGAGIGVCYNPELVALGATLDGFQRPDLVLIGKSDQRSGELVEGIQRKLVRNNAPIRRMSLASAEIAKLALNAYVTMKISYANLIAQLCDRIPDADPDAVTGALGADSRIGPKFLRGGTSFGGPCFPRDTKAFMRMARDHGLPPDLLAAVDGINDAQGDLLARTVLAQVSKAPARRVGVLGLAYKGGTPVIAASAAVALIHRLRREEIAVVGYDRLALDNASRELGDGFDAAVSAAACVAAAPILVLVNPEPDHVAALATYAGSEPRIVVDCWRVLDRASLPATIEIIGLGRYWGP